LAGKVKKGSLTSSLIAATIACSLSQFLVGYNIAVHNPTENVIFPGHSTLGWSTVVAALPIGAIFGTIIGGPLCDYCGRRSSLIVDALGFLSGGILQVVAPNLEFLMIARFTVGIMSGIATVLVPIYLGELAPPHLRGTLGTINQFALVVGILVADILSFPLATEDGWRFLLGIASLLAFIQVILGFFVVESPRYLLHCNPLDAHAKDILRKLRGHASMEDVDEEVETYVIADSAQRTARAAVKYDIEGLFKSNQNNIKHKKDGNGTGDILYEMVTLPDIRFHFWCGIILNIGQQLCGVNAIFYYSTSLFEEVIPNPLVGTTSIGTINVIFTYVALLLMDACRRKNLLLWSIGGMLFSCTGLILCQCGSLQSENSQGTGEDKNGEISPIRDPIQVLVLMFANLFVAFYAIGLGPIPCLWIAETIKPRYVSLAMTISCTLSWGVNFAVGGLLFPLMNQYLKGLTFLPFAVILVACFFFVWKFLPADGEATSATADASTNKIIVDETVNQE
jgi:SP family facilitated glucose transporter-like MFS transporter 3